MKHMNKSWLFTALAICGGLFLFSCDDDTSDAISSSNTVGLLDKSSTAVEGDAATFSVVYFGLPENQPGDITVNYTVEGAGITSFNGSVTIPDGEQTAEFSVVVPENNSLTLDTLDLLLTLTGTNSVAIKDDPAFNSHVFELLDDIKTISLVNDTVDISEDFSITGDTLKVPINITNAIDAPVNLPYTLSGTAQAGVDYELVSANPLVLSTGATSANIMFIINNDLDLEGTETLAITLNDIVLTDANDEETTLAEGVLNRNRVYNIIDDTKMVGFTLTEEDTLMISEPGEYTVEVVVENADLINPLDVLFDETNLPAGVMDNNTTNTLSFSPNESSRIITFTVSEAAFTGADVIGSYDIMSLNGNGDAEVVLSANTSLNIKIIDEQ